VSRPHAERGSAAVEFALVLPLLLVIVVGVVQFGLVFHTRMSLQSAAREGGRVASVPGVGSAEVVSRVSSALGGADDLRCPPGPGENCIKITPEQAVPCDERPGQEVVVEVSAPHSLEIPFFGSRALTLTGRAVFRCE
jgi:hypothetical protein